MLLSWWRKLAQQSKSGKGRRPRSAGYRLGLEYLEDRTVPAFLAPVTYAAGTAPIAIAVGDFNGDAHQDIVTVNNTSVGTVTVLLGNGDGTFQAPVSSAVGTSPTAVAVADFNGDGKLDVAVGGPGYVNILIGNGDGSFQAPVQYLLGSVPNHLASADFNGDGHPDIVLSDGATVKVLMNHGDGTFAPPTILAAGPSAMDVEVGDINHDGKQDLVVANHVSNGSVSALLGNGDGTFQAARSYFAGSAPWKVALGDFNHDGNLDIVALNSYTSTSMNLLMGNGDGTYRPTTWYGLGADPGDVQAADFNGDGNIDLIEPTGAGYQVEMGRGDGSFYAPTNYATFTGGHSAIGDFNGDGVPDVATSSPTGVIVLVNANNSIANLAGATGLQVTTPVTVTAGQPFAVTVTAVDANGVSASGFTGTVAIIPGTQAGTQPLSYTFTPADAGTHTFTSALTYLTAGTQTVDVTTPFLPVTSQTVMVTAAAATHFAVSAPASTSAGASVALTVTALDAYGNVAGYTGAVAFSSSDVQAGLPTAYAFTAADAGTHAFTANLKTAGAQTLTARDTTTLTLTGSAGILVTPNVATTFSVVGGAGAVGVLQPVTISVRDLYGNLVSGYSGSVHVTSSDASAVLPGDAALVNGTATGIVRMMTVGTQTLTATDTANPAFVGTETITVTAATVAGFDVAGFPATTAGATHTFGITVRNTLGQVMTGYTGTVVFSSSDWLAGLPTSYTFTTADKGTHNFTATLKTAGSESITARDSMTYAANGTQAGIAVTASAATTFTVAGFPATVAGVAQTFTVTARDAYGNVATGYTGTVKFTSTDKQAILPANYRFTAADAGVQTFAGTFKTAQGSHGVGGQTLTVQDTANVAIVSSQANILVTPAAMTNFGITYPSNLAVGTPFTLKIVAQDDFGNKVDNYLGTIHFTISAGLTGLPTDYTFTSADIGQHSFTITLTTSLPQTISFVDVANALLQGSATMNSGTAPPAGGGGSGGGGGGGRKP